MTIRMSINGKGFSANTGADRSLIDFLREELNLTGTKRGCDDGSCGACTVIINGEAKRACKTKLSDLNNAEIVTIEGVSFRDNNNEEVLHPVQKAFIEAGAIQCGFCTPAMVLTTIVLLNKNSNPSEDDIKKALAGNLCRCTGYVQIIEAIKLASKSISKNN